MEPFAMENEKDTNRCNDEKDSEKKEEKLVEFLKQFTEDTSIHGVKHAFNQTKSPQFRVVWMALGLIAVCSLLRMLYDLFCSYLDHQVQTVLMVTPSDQLPFPAVTICNLNGLELRKLKAQDTEAVNVSAAIIALTLMTSQLSTHFSDYNETLEQFFPPAFLNRNFQEISHTAYADLNETLISCVWEGQEERCEDLFSPLDMDMRRCFQFNGRRQDDRRVSLTSGLDSGLQVLVNVKQDEYIYNEVFSAGAQVILHEPGEMPDISNKGFLVAPGASVVCRTTRKKYNYLPDPFMAYGSEACVADELLVPPATRERANVTVYTSALCHRMCVEALAQNKCGCRLSDVSVVYNASLPLCTVWDVYTCYLDAFANENRKAKSADCKCPRRCRHTEYEVTLSSAYFPSDVSMDILESISFIYTGMETNNARKNYFSLKIFYDDLVSHEIEHVPKYTLDSVLGTIGGQLGLFIGASLLSVMEVTYLLLTVCHRAARATWYRLRPNSA